MHNTRHAAAFLVFLTLSTAAAAEDPPNIVLVFMDNFGSGEPGINGGGVVQGAPAGG